MYFCTKTINRPINEEKINKYVLGKFFNFSKFYNVCRTLNKSLVWIFSIRLVFFYSLALHTTLKMYRHNNQFADIFCVSNLFSVDYQMNM